MTPEQRKRNEAIVAAMTDEDLREIKHMVTTEQARRIQDEINAIGKKQ